MREIKIFCPKCAWVPHPSDVWQCSSPCYCVWHTFDTCGVCPKCGKNWEHTICLACHRWSPHVDWDHEFLPDRGKQAEQELVVAVPVRPETGSDPCPHRRRAE